MESEKTYQKITCPEENKKEKRETKS